MKKIYIGIPHASDFPTTYMRYFDPLIDPKKIIRNTKQKTKFIIYVNIKLAQSDLPLSSGKYFFLRVSATEVSLKKHINLCNNYFII